jgi:Amt family ammonium transporter
LGGIGGVSLGAQCIGSGAAIVFAMIFGSLVYLGLKKTTGIRLSEEQEIRGADLSIHNISAYPERDIRTI